jgi:hypothetical protein
MFDLLKRPRGSSLKELMKMTGGQTQSVADSSGGQTEEEIGGLKFDLSSAKESAFTQSKGN